MIPCKEYDEKVKNHNVTEEVDTTKVSLPKIKYNPTMDWLVIPLEAVELVADSGLHSAFRVKGDSTVLGATFIEYIECYKGSGEFDPEDYPKVLLYSSTCRLLNTWYKAGRTCCELIIMFGD